jgi:GAF domain-containing protein
MLCSHEVDRTPSNWHGAPRGWRPMLLKLSNKIIECLAHAADARERANAATDPALKANLLDIELRWLSLVESYRFAEQPSRFLAAKADSKRDKHLTLPAAFNDASVADLLDVLVRTAFNHVSLFHLLDVLVRTVIEKGRGEARAAFYIADGAKLHHVTGMPEAYARYVDGFAISPKSLACGLAASTGQPIITRDVAEEPLWKPWVWLATQFDYRACWSFPVKTSSGKIVGTFAMYFRKPREATESEIDFAATITRAAAVAMSRPRPSLQ